MERTQNAELETLKYEAAKAILEAIKSKVVDGEAIYTLRLAEAFAWLMAPYQSHGGGVQPPKTP